MDTEEKVVPNSCRILHDIAQAVRSMESVAKANGKMVPGLANRNGHRNEGAVRSNNHGGRRVKGSGKEKERRWLHVDARGVKINKQQAIVTKYGAVDNINNE